MNLKWHSANDFEVDVSGLDTVSYGDIFILDEDTGIVYQGRMGEGTDFLLNEVEEFLKEPK